MAESHPRVKAYVKNHNLGLEVPYRYGSETRKYLPDFIVLVDDGHGDDDPLHLIVEIKGYRREDAKEKKATMETYWVPGVNNQGHYGRWAFAEFTEVYQIEADFEAKVEAEFNKMIESVTAQQAVQLWTKTGVPKPILDNSSADAKGGLSSTDAIWTGIESSPDHAFRTCRMLTLWRASVSCDGEDTLARVSIAFASISTVSQNGVSIRSR